MDSTVPNGVENGRVLALAGVAAGVVGTLLMALTGRRDRKPARTTVTLSATVPAGLVHSAQHTREDVGAIIGGQLAQATERGKRAQKAAKRGQKKMNKSKTKETGKHAVHDAKRSLNPLMRQRQQNTKKATDTARRQIAQLTHQGADVTAQAKERLGQLTQQSPNPLRDLRQRTVELAHVGADRAQDSARALSQTAVERGQTVKDNVAPQVESLKSNVAPQVKSIKSNAEDRIEDLVAQGRQRAATLKKDTEKDVLPVVKHIAAHARETLENLPESVSDELPAVRDKAGQLKSTAADRATAAQQQASEKTKQVATTTAEGSKDLGATVSWLALGGALVYFVFLDEDQRTQIRNVADRLFGRAIATYRDIQGFDQEFG